MLEDDDEKFLTRYANDRIVSRREDGGLLPISGPSGTLDFEAAEDDAMRVDSLKIPTSSRIVLLSDLWPATK